MRLPKDVFDDLQKHIGEDYENKKSKGMFASWLKLKQNCKDAGIQVPSYSELQILHDSHAGLCQTPQSAAAVHHRG